ncbi:hypothetical protein HN801_02285 [Candidatus Peregrinibacteria bacterium]|jgi:hypothetical protein|nr:hypothetical protein [Candidatus Peregrinibacteria bacterium]
MASEENPWEEFDQKCDAWLAKVIDSELISVLGNELHKLEPDRGSDNLFLFRTYLLSYCYYCCVFDTDLDGKLNKDFREKDIAFYEEGPLIVRGIDDLLSFTKKCPELHEVLHKDRNLNFEDILTEYRNQLALAIHMKDRKKFPHWKQHGNLYYPNDIQDQAKRRVPQANSLLFGLVFYLRQYTDETTPESVWMQRVEGPMPTTGRPHYELVAQIANAVNELCTPPIFDNKLSDEQVRKRIKTLIDNNVELSLSTGLRYSQLRKSINKSH